MILVTFITIIWISVLVKYAVLSSLDREDTLKLTSYDKRFVDDMRPRIFAEQLTLSLSSTRRTLKNIKTISPNNRKQLEVQTEEHELPDNFFDSGSEEEDLENDNDSVVSESLLEGLGLRSRTSTPSSLSSPSQHLKKMIGSSSSLAFLRQNQKADGSQSESESGEDGNYVYLNDQDYQFDLIEIDTEEMEIEKPSEVQKKTILILPDPVLVNIMEYCGDATLLEARTVNKKFKESCDFYLELMSKLTLTPLQASVMTFPSKFALSSTMMPFYRKQKQVSDLIASQLNQEAWRFMILVEMSDLTGFTGLKIFSDEFISGFLLPRMEKDLEQANPFDPSPIFLLGEALLKSKRSQLFDAVVLPVLNRVSVVIYPQIAESELMSPNFASFQEGQRVLGSTLHVAINYNLNYTVKHLVKLDQEVMKLRNQHGMSALMKIIDYLGKTRSPTREELSDDWLETTIRKFHQGEAIQENFTGNSRLAVEMVLVFLNEISEMFSSPQETISFLQVNQSFDILVNVGGNSYHRTTTILHELVLARQYDLILALGFYFGDLIRSQLDINPLHMAAEMDDPVLVGILLKFYPQIDVNQLTTSGSTAVGLAVGKKCVKSLKALLNDPRTDLNLNKSVSPLIRSIEICPIEAVELLLSHPSINVNHQITRNSKILSPLGRAVTQRKWPVLDLLLQHPNANYDPDNDRVVLQHLKEAEKCLIRYGDQYYDLLMLIRRLILPTISE